MWLKVQTKLLNKHRFSDFRRDAANKSYVCRQRQITRRGTASLHNSCSEDHDARTPLVDAVQKRANRKTETPFHVPGHKRGQGAPSKLKELLGPDALAHDLTELDGLDYLAYPTGVIKEAQEKAARAFGADYTWFLVNGTTVGIQAAMMATCIPGSGVILPRNCHQSVVSGLVLSGAVPVFVPPPVLEGFDFATGMTARGLRAALDEARARRLRVGAVLAVSPTYFGTCGEIGPLAEICHRAGVPLIVDEAHGPHLSLLGGAARGALQEGADLVVQSTHKVLGSMTQSSMLHLKGGRVPPERVSQALQTLQSSSPSYILMASLDAARAEAAGGSSLRRAAAAATLARTELSGLPGIDVLTDRIAPCDGVTAIDPLRLTCCVRGLGISGYEASRLLEEEHGVVAELSTQQVVVFAFGSGSTEDHAAELVSAMTVLARRRRSSPAAIDPCPDSQRPRTSARASALSSGATVSMSPREAFFASHKRVGFWEAAGATAAELLCPYPPGIPVVMPGEVVSEEALRLLADVSSSGGTVLGASDASLSSLLVVDSGA